MGWNTLNIVFHSLRTLDLSLLFRESELLCIDPLSHDPDVAILCNIISTRVALSQSFLDGDRFIREGFAAVRRLDSRSTLDPNSILSDVQVLRLLGEISHWIEDAVEEFRNRFREAIDRVNRKGQTSDIDEGSKTGKGSLELCELSKSEMVNEIQNNGQDGINQLKESESESELIQQQENRNENQQDGHLHRGSSFHDIVQNLRRLFESANDGGLSELSEETSVCLVSLVIELQNRLIEISQQKVESESTEIELLKQSDQTIFTEQSLLDNRNLRFAAVIYILTAIIKVVTAMESLSVPSRSVTEKIINVFSQSVQHCQSNESSDLAKLTFLINCQINLHFILRASNLTLLFLHLYNEIFELSSKSHQPPTVIPIANLSQTYSFIKSSIQTLHSTQYFIFNPDFLETYFFLIDHSFNFLTSSQSFLLKSDQIILHSFQLLLRTFLLFTLALQSKSIPWIYPLFIEWLLGIHTSNSLNSFPCTNVTLMFRLESFVSFLCHYLDPTSFLPDLNYLQQLYYSQTLMLLLLDILKSLVLFGVSSTPLKLLPSLGSPISTSLIGVLIRLCRLFNSYSRSSHLQSIDFQFLLLQSSSLLHLLSQHEDFSYWLGESRGGTSDLSSILGIAMEEIDRFENQSSMMMITDTTPFVNFSLIPFTETSLNLSKAQSFPIDSLIYFIEQGLTDFFIHLLTPIESTDQFIIPLWKTIDVLANLFARLENEHQSGSHPPPQAMLYRIGQSSIVQRIIQNCLEMDHLKNPNEIQMKIRNAFRYQTIKFISSMTPWQSCNELESWIKPTGTNDNNAFTIAYINHWLTSASTEVVCWSLDILISLIKSCDIQVLLSWIHRSCHCVLIRETKRNAEQPQGVLGALLTACNSEVTAVRSRAMISALALYVSTGIARFEEIRVLHKMNRESNVYEFVLTKLEKFFINSITAKDVQDLFHKWDSLKNSIVSSKSQQFNTRSSFSEFKNSSVGINYFIYDVYQSALDQTLTKVFELSEIPTFNEANNTRFKIDRLILPWTSSNLDSSFSILFPNRDASAAILAFLCRSVEYKLSDQIPEENFDFVLEWLCSETAQLIAKHASELTTPDSNHLNKKTIIGLLSLLLELFKSLSVITTKILLPSDNHSNKRICKKTFNSLIPLVKLQQLLFRFTIDPFTSHESILAGVLPHLVISYFKIPHLIELSDAPHHNLQHFDSREVTPMILILLFSFLSTESNSSHSMNDRSTSCLSQWVQQKVPLAQLLINEFNQFQNSDRYSDQHPPVSIRQIHSLADRLRIREIDHHVLDAGVVRRSSRNGFGTRRLGGIELLDMLGSGKILLIDSEERNCIDSALIELVSSTIGGGMIQHWCNGKRDINGIRCLYDRFEIAQRSIRVNVLDIIMSFITQNEESTFCSLNLSSCNDSMFNPPTSPFEETIRKSVISNGLLSEILRSLRDTLKLIHSSKSQSNLLLTIKLMFEILFVSSPIELCIVSDCNACHLPSFLINGIIPLFFNHQFFPQAFSVFSIVIALLSRSSLHHFISCISVYGIYGESSSESFDLERHPVTVSRSGTFPLPSFCKLIVPRWNSRHRSTTLSTSLFNPSSSSMTIPLGFIQWSSMTIWSICLLCFIGLPIQDYHYQQKEEKDENQEGSEPNAKQQIEFSNFNGFDSQLSELLLTTIWLTLKSRCIQFIVGHDIDLSEDYILLKQLMKRFDNDSIDDNNIECIGKSPFCCNAKRYVKLNVVDSTKLLSWMRRHYASSIIVAEGFPELITSGNISDDLRDDAIYCNALRNADIKLLNETSIEISRTQFINCFLLFPSRDSNNHHNESAINNYECLQALFGLFIGITDFQRHLYFETLLESFRLYDKKHIEFLSDDTSRWTLDLIIIQLIDSSIIYLPINDLKSALLLNSDNNLTLSIIKSHPVFISLAHYILSSIFLFFQSCQQSPAFTNIQINRLILPLQAAANLFASILVRLLSCISFSLPEIEHKRWELSSGPIWSNEFLLVKAAIVCAYLNLDHLKSLAFSIMNETSPILLSGKQCNNNEAKSRQKFDGESRMRFYSPSLKGIATGSRLSDLRNLIQVSELDVIDVLKIIVDGLFMFGKSEKEIVYTRREQTIDDEHKTNQDAMDAIDNKATNLVDASISQDEVLFNGSNKEKEFVALTESVKVECDVEMHDFGIQTTSFNLIEEDQQHETTSNAIEPSIPNTDDEIRQVLRELQMEDALLDLKLATVAKKV